MATKLGRMVIYLERLLTTKLYKVVLRWSLQGHVTIKHTYSSNTRVPIASKLGTMMTYLDGLLTPIKSHYLLITWSCKIT